MAARKILFDSQDEEESLLKTKPKDLEEIPKWDSFQDPLTDDNTGSSSGWEGFDILIKILKLFLYLFVFALIFGSSILSKSTYLLMVAQLQQNNKVNYCNITYPNRQFSAQLPQQEQIAWTWALVFAFITPEVFTFIRSFRIWFFKNIPKPPFSSLCLVGFMETFHVIGLSILTFVIFPNINTLQALMLTNCVSFVPGLLSLFSTGTPGTIEQKNKLKSLILFFVNIFAICGQMTGFVLWPMLHSDKWKLWLIPVALTLTSLRWWENYISILGKFQCLNHLNVLRDKINNSRYFIHLGISPWKIFIFMLCAFTLDGKGVNVHLSKFHESWNSHKIQVKEISLIFNDRLGGAVNSENANNEIVTIMSSESAQLWILILHIASSYLCYVFAKYACKIKIQVFSFSIPLTLAVPGCVGILFAICGLRETDPCAFHNYLPDYLAFKGPSIYKLWPYIYNEYAWVWLIWCISQAWITRHIWYPENDKNASTEKLFATPWYCSFLIDQCITMNRRIFDKEGTGIKEDDAELPIENNTNDNIISHEIPQVYVCATMWHETKEEMMEFLKSILRLDEDQCARTMVRKYMLPEKSVEDDFNLETHIFFDDAFVQDADKVEDSENPPINSYVKLLVNNIEEAAMKVYKTKIYIEPPTKIKTPYGGQLVWTLPGRTKMIAHLKNKNKIRHKKRWSQVMYMYYILGLKIMEQKVSSQKKIQIARNTFLLALDGDIDFQPNAVHLLIGRMKVDPFLGAACGRIHPIGKGPMVWYQVFEYSIGHWLQKATEHVIGCVLCSPGCFSLFRGEALMEDNVMKKYTTKSEEARHYVQYDQGEDRWLCTLILKKKYRVEYSAASDAYTHAPEGFNEFYNQRRRWIPSTIANILDLLGDAKVIVECNNSISMPYIFYQGMLMAGTILGPGTIFLMMVGSLVAVFRIDIWTSFLWNFIPVISFMGICYFAKQKYQLIAAFVISALYSLVMMAVLIGIIIQVIDDGILSPASLFFVAVAGQIVITGLMHPREVGALLYGIVYYITIPSMYLLLMIYSVFNMNDVSWGTRENPTPASQQKAKSKDVQNQFQKLFGFLRPNQNDEEEGSLDLSCSGLFRCMFCTHPKSSTVETQLLLMNEQFRELNNKIKNLELKLSGEVTIMTLTEKEKILEQPKIILDIPKVQEIQECEKLPGWLGDPDLDHCILDSLPTHETIFWSELIRKYLYPLDQTEFQREKAKNDLKNLRDVTVFAFVMINALFVLVVFLLQLNKSELHIQWPFNAKNTLQFNYVNREIIISREYLELEPIGSLFVVFFGIILVIQFAAMFVHRFATLSQLLASVSLNWNFGTLLCGSDRIVKDQLGAVVERARFYQRPKVNDDDDDEVDNNQTVARPRHTITRLAKIKAKPIEYCNLEKNFRKVFLDESKSIDLQKICTSKTFQSIVENRKSCINQRKTITNGRNLDSIKHTSSGAYENPAFESDNGEITPRRFSHNGNKIFI